MWYFPTLFQTSPKIRYPISHLSRSCFGLCRQLRRASNSRNHAQFQTRTRKHYPISDLEGQKVLYLIWDKTARKPNPVQLHIPAFPPFPRVDACQEIAGVLSWVDPKPSWYIHERLVYWELTTVKYSQVRWCSKLYLVIKHCLGDVKWVLAWVMQKWFTASKTGERRARVACEYRRFIRPRAGFNRVGVGTCSCHWTRTLLVGVQIWREIQ